MQLVGQVLQQLQLSQHNNSLITNILNPGIKTPGFFVGLNTYIMIFESPDGGKTVYGRLAHTIQREELTTQDPAQVDLNNLWFIWRDILTASKTNATLKDALDRAHVIYELSRRDKD